MTSKPLLVHKKFGDMSQGEQDNVLDHAGDKAFMTGKITIDGEDAFPTPVIIEYLPAEDLGAVGDVLKGHSPEQDIDRRFKHARTKETTLAFRSYGNFLASVGAMVVGGLQMEHTAKQHRRNSYDGYETKDMVGNAVGAAVGISLTLVGLVLWQRLKRINRLHDMADENFQAVRKERLETYTEWHNVLHMRQNAYEPD